MCFLQVSATSIDIKPWLTLVWRLTIETITTTTTTTKLKTQFSLELRSTNFVKRDNKLCAKSDKELLLFLLGNQIITTMINIFKDTLLATRKFHSLMEICVSWILLIGFLIWKSILIFGRFVKKKKYGLHLIIGW